MTDFEYENRIKYMHSMQKTVFVAVALSCLAVFSSIVLIPMVYFRMQRTLTQIQPNIEECKIDTQYIWKDIDATEEALGTKISAHRRLRRHTSQRPLVASNGYSTAFPGKPTSRKATLSNTPASYAGPPRPTGTSGRGNAKGAAAGDSDGGCCGCGRGLAGPPGPPGAAGDPGPDGQEGQRGASGKDADLHGTPTEDDFCFECPPGPAGPQGAPGPKGDDGPVGQPGKDGRNGEPGPPGPAGYPGPKGEPGEPGENGDRGVDGELSEEEGLAGPPGPPGARGPPGEPGEDGRKGQDGVPGPIGPQGEPGSKGPRGANGADGPRGKPGDNGPKGSCDHCPEPRLETGYWEKRQPQG